MCIRDSPTGGIAVAASLDQTCVFADHAGDCIGDDAVGVGSNGIHSVQTLVAILHVGAEASEIATTNRCSFGVSADDCAGECVEHWGPDSFGDAVLREPTGEQAMKTWEPKGGGSADPG